MALMVSSRDVTALLGDWSRGNRTALHQLMPLVYAELRRVAARQLRNERADHTLQPTVLVHEVYIRLVDQRHVDWQNRAHFFGVAAQVMRRILVDHARRHGASKRGEGVRCVSIDEANDVPASNEMPILAYDHALDRLPVACGSGLADFVAASPGQTSATLLAPSRRIGAYEVFGLLGAGAMGEVYRARDTKLNREVALKVVPDLFALGPEHLARVTR